MGVRLASIIIPVYNQADSIGVIIDQYLQAFKELDFECELLAVVNGPRRDNSLEICRENERNNPVLRTLVVDQGGWGRAVRHGLENAKGDLICYTNCARTTAADLVEMLKQGARNEGCVIRSRRMVRESLRRRAGSTLYNAECRLLFGLNWQDLNATPKVFPRQFAPLMQLTENGDLIDLELHALCKRWKYRVIEFPIYTKPSAARKSTTGWKSAFKMYAGAMRLRWNWKAR
jgi:hypothetical protein